MHRPYNRDAADFAARVIGRAFFGLCAAIVIALIYDVLT